MHHGTVLSGEEVIIGVNSPCLPLCFLDNPRQISRVPVYVRVLDVNDNAPTFATNYETFVCENAKANQVGVIKHKAAVVVSS